jgi:hypothetical protein
MGVAVYEEGRKSRRRRQNPLQQHSSRARARERERERERRLYTTLAVTTAVGCLSSKRYAAKQAHPKMNFNKHLKNDTLFLLFLFFLLSFFFLFLYQFRGFEILAEFFQNFSKSSRIRTK